MRHFILVDKKVVPCPDPDTEMVWAKWFETADRKIKKDKIGYLTVSTIFIGVAEDELFETMIFGLPDDAVDKYYQARCRTYDEAITMHEQAVEVAKKYFKRPTEL